MLHATELRVGNFLLFDGIPCQITAIECNLDSISFDQNEDGKCTFTGLSTGRIMELRITDDVLERAGFKQVRQISDCVWKWTIETTKFMLYYNGEYAGLITSLPRSIPIHYLHQLQNLYFSLVGEELHINITASLV